MATPSPQTFSTLPILPLSHALDPSTKPKFLQDLRHALLNVGFLYLSDTGLPDELVKAVIRECQGFFKELPKEEKERIEMKNEKSFLGWSRVSYTSFPVSVHLRMYDAVYYYDLCVVQVHVVKRWTNADANIITREKEKERGKYASRS
jgi:isopenicillin N synthase-like dioxygenase